MTESIEVVGGLGGVEVQYDDMDAAAAVLRSAALDTAGIALSVRGVLTDAGLLASALLDPVGFARVETAVLAAVVGPHGLLFAAARIEHRSLALEAAVLRYAAADQLGAGWRELRHWAEGIALVAAIPSVPLLLGSPLGGMAAAWVRDGDANTFLAHHPGIAEEAVGAAPAFLDGVFLLVPGLGALTADAACDRIGGPRVLTSSVEDAAALLGLAYPAGRPVVTGRGVDRSAPPAPRSVTDLLAALQHRDHSSTGDAQGEIDVRRLTRTGPGGAPVTSWVVDLPGTKEWQFDPRRREHLNDFATNLTTMAGDHSARVDGLTRALELAGVGKDEPVMLVGHSQGGLVALRAAQEYDRTGAFAVTHVVTAGSPTSRIEAPASVSVLALENRYDLVPRLDGQPSEPDANRVTVVFDAQRDDIGRNHGLATTYLPAGEAVDASHDHPSLAAWREGAGAFLAGRAEQVSVRTTVWDVRNGG
jgi:hypothetical protein